MIMLREIALAPPLEFVDKSAWDNLEWSKSNKPDKYNVLGSCYGIYPRNIVHFATPEMGETLFSTSSWKIPTISNIYKSLEPLVRMRLCK